MSIVANGALVLATIGVLAMLSSAAFYNSAYNMDCADTNYLNVEYGEGVEGADELCYDEYDGKRGLSILLNDVGYALLLFSLVLMIGANRLD